MELSVSEKILHTDFYNSKFNPDFVFFKARIRFDQTNLFNFFQKGFDDLFDEESYD